MIFQRWPSTYYLEQNKKHIKSINPKKYLITYVTYLNWKLKNSFLGYTEDLTSQILKKKICIHYFYTTSLHCYRN